MPENNPDPVRYRLVYDPSNTLLEFRSTFHTGEWSDTLKFGMWPEGSIWKIEYRDGSETFVIVEGTEFEPQREQVYVPGTGSHAVQ